MIQFNDRKNATHELSLSVHDSGPGWNVWLAEVEGDTRYFEAADDLEVWDLIDLAVHCYDEETQYPAKNPDGKNIAEMFFPEMQDLTYAFDAQNIVNLGYLNGTPANNMNEAGARAEMFKEYTRAGQSLPQTVEGADLKRLSEMNEEDDLSLARKRLERNNQDLLDRHEETRVALDRITSRDLSETNAPNIEYPALYRKLLSPEEFTD